MCLDLKRHEDAWSFHHALEARLTQFNLTQHPEKARLLRFGRYAGEDCKKRGEEKPETFDFLGFTHFCSLAKNGMFEVGAVGRAIASCIETSRPPDSGVPIALKPVRKSELAEIDTTVTHIVLLLRLPEFRRHPFATRDQAWAFQSFEKWQQPSVAQVATVADFRHVEHVDRLLVAQKGKICHVVHYDIFCRLRRNTT